MWLANVAKGHRMYPLKVAPDQLGERGFRPVFFIGLKQLPVVHRGVHRHPIIHARQPEKGTRKRNHRGGKWFSSLVVSEVREAHLDVERLKVGSLSRGTFNAQRSTSNFQRLQLAWLVTPSSRPIGPARAGGRRRSGRRACAPVRSRARRDRAM